MKPSPLRAVIRSMVAATLLFSMVLPPGLAVAESPPDTAQTDRIAEHNEAMQQSFISQEQREAAALRYKLMRQVAEISAAGSVTPSAAELTQPTPGGIPDYFGAWANWAYSPLLRKFVDTLPGVGPGAANNLGNYISEAHPDTTTYQGYDYYEIELREYEQQLHSDMPPTRLRGYVQVNNGTDGAGNNTIAPDPISYLGPFISATKNRPVRVKFTNKLPIDTGGDLFIPVDTSVMGAGMGPLMHMAMPMNYSQNRAALHLHGGITPWISDGTPHQWITPANEFTSYPEGVSVENVPDMPDPGDGSMTFFYTNQQSARLMWYHDHAYGITRLNVYAGEAAAYALTDDVEQQLISDGIIPGPAETLPLIVQDKTFVDADTIMQTDPTWNWGSTAPVPHTGDLWMPHVYVPAQNPADPGGMNATGRWHYGPWFWPPTQDIAHGPIDNPYYDPLGGTPWEYYLMPATPQPSMGMEAFHDTPLVNGSAYPVLEVDPKTYRFRILNAASDRFWNLQMYEADAAVVSADGRTNTEVKMVPAAPNAEYEALYPDIVWPTDGRAGGAPDPATAGPEWVQIATESGFLPAPAIIPNQPITWNGDPTTFNMGNVEDHSLLLGPAERADVIVDFSQYAGKTLILYNDAPTAFPALDPRTDYYTGAPDMTDTGGTKTPEAGFGPNTRTIMQIKVAAAAPAPAYDLASLQAAFVSTGTSESVFEASQNPIIIPDSRYDAAYNDTFPADPYVRIFENLDKTWEMMDGTSVTLPLEPKAIQDEMGESFDREYGRMSGNFGLQIPGVGGALQNFILYGFMDPPTENLVDQMTPLSPVMADGTQIWRITHNGVDTHPVHFHLYDVQLINRVGWDGALRPPDDNELGWKETVRVSPLEDTIVALKPVAPKLPFALPDSVRPLDPTMPLGTTDQFSPFDELGQPRTVENAEYNFGWEYVFHCHILSHEEMDMMRPVTLAVDRSIPDAPNPLGATGSPGGPVTLTWTDMTPPTPNLTVESPLDTTNEVGFRIERALVEGGDAGPFETIATGLANSESYVDSTTIDGRSYGYRVVAFNASEDPTLLGATNTADVTAASTFDSVVATPTATYGGSVTPATPQGVPVGSPADVTFDFTADAGYHIADVLVDDVSVGAVNSYTFTAMDADHTIHVVFAVNEYEITPTAGPNGQIVWNNVQNPPPGPPASNPMVQHDVMLKTLAFVPDPGYQVANVLVDGVSVGAPEFYTFSNVVEPHSIHVDFEPAAYTITSSAGPGGSISPSGAQVVSGGTDITFTMTPNAGYELVGLKVDGTDVPLAPSYTFTNVMTSHTIEAIFGRGVRYEDSDPRFFYFGSWGGWSNAALSGGTYVYANGASSAVEGWFEGTSLKLIARTGPEFGIARVIVDGGTPQAVDLYAPATSYQQLVWSSIGLAPGWHSLRVEWTGQRNSASAGTYIGLDAVDVDASTPPPLVGATRLEEGDTLVGSSGTWSTWSNAALSGGTYAYANSMGATKRFKFQGTRLDIVARTGPEFGVAKITVDGQQPWYIDLYSPTTAYQQDVFSSWPLANGDHTVTLEWTGRKNAFSTGTYVGVDAVDVVGTALQAQGRYEQTDTRIGFLGAWNNWTNFALSGGSYVYANAPGSQVNVRFSGTSVDLIGRQGPEFGMAVVSVDGGVPQVIDLYSPLTQYQQVLYSASGLTPGPHFLSLEWTGTKNLASAGTYVSFDAVDLDGVPLQAPGRIEQDYASVSLINGWAHWTSASLSGGSYTYSNADGGHALVDYYGTHVALVARTGPEFGIASVSIDGGTAVMVDLYSPTTQYKRTVLTTDPQAPGDHQLRIEWTGTKNAASSDTYINLDAVDALMAVP